MRYKFVSVFSYTIITNDGFSVIEAVETCFCTGTVTALLVSLAKG